MKTPSMTFEEVYAQLESWGSEGVRKIYARQGAGENQFGVKLSDLRGLAKKLKTNHPLALQLWASGNADAMIPATMLMDSAQLTQSEVAAMLQPLTYYRLVDELIYNAVARPPLQRHCANPGWTPPKK
jgi:3-methyladenine DNA glycosylase AlkD